MYERGIFLSIFAPFFSLLQNKMQDSDIPQIIQSNKRHLRPICVKLLDRGKDYQTRDSNHKLTD